MATDELHEHFLTHGWAVVRGVVGAARLAELEAQVDWLYATWPPTRPGEVWEVPSVSRASPETLGRHTHDPVIAEYVARALGCDAVQLLQDTVLVKSASDGAKVAWHQDHIYTGYLRPSQLASVRLALTPCTVESGCLRVIDRSHLDEPLEVKALTESHVADALGDAALALADRVVSIELAPGDISIHHCLTMHGSEENRSGGPRKTLITRIFDAACTLDRARLPPGAEQYFPTDNDGHLDPAGFPVLWRRSP